LALAHFKALCFIVNCLLSCLFPSITNDIHIIGPLSIISFAYEYSHTKLCTIGLFIQLLKCVAWSPFGPLFNFNTPSQFTTPSKGIRVLRVPLAFHHSHHFFIKDALLKNDRHVDLFHRMGDVQIAFGILIHCFMQRPSYLLWYTPPSPPPS
jgi:hypothetical protein